MISRKCAQKLVDITCFREYFNLTLYPPYVHHVSHIYFFVINEQIKTLVIYIPNNDRKCAKTYLYKNNTFIKKFLTL